MFENRYEMKAEVPSHVKMGNPLTYMQRAFMHADLEILEVKLTGTSYTDGSQKLSLIYQLDANVEREPTPRFFQELSNAAQMNQITIKDFGHPGHEFRAFRFR